MIASWSHSSLSNFERCKFLAWLKHDQRIPEPPRPLPPGTTEHANDRGTRVHDHAEHYVAGKRDDQPPEMKEFAVELAHLRRLYTLGLVSLEGEWAVDRNWVPCEWKQAWHRSKIDAFVMPNEYQAIVIDYKTGRKFGNEIKHAEQTQLYALNAIFRYPKLEEVTTELWYPDVKDLTSVTFTRQQVLRFKHNFDRRGHAMTSCTDFPPNPNIHVCKYCEYGPWNGGQCTKGVRLVR